MSNMKEAVQPLDKLHLFYPKLTRTSMVVVILRKYVQLKYFYKELDIFVAPDHIFVSTIRWHDPSTLILLKYQIAGKIQ